MPISYIWKLDFRFFLICDGNLWKIMSIFSIWKLNFRVFSGLMMGASFKNGISVSFWAFLENNANIFLFENGISVFFLELWWEPHLKTEFPCLFGLFWKIMPISSIWRRDFPFLGSWWESLENNVNIFYLKTGFPFFWAYNGNLWKIMSIFSFWKRDFRYFFWLVMATSGK